MMSKYMDFNQITSNYIELYLIISNWHFCIYSFIALRARPVACGWLLHPTFMRGWYTWKEHTKQFITIYSNLYKFNANLRKLY